MLRRIVEDYMKSEWVKYGRDVGFYKARSESIGASRITFCEPGTTTPKAVYSDKELTMPMFNPVIADSDGVYPQIYLNGGYSLTLEHRDGDGDYLVIMTTREGFDLYA